MNINSTLYKWTRYWIAQEGIKVIYDRNDFPIYSTQGYGKFHIKMGIPLSSLEYSRCLILLGEPGTGKSTELMLARGSEGYTAKYNLSHHSTEREVVDAIESLKEFKDWKLSDQKLFLYLDGFDEAMLHVRTINHALTRWLAMNSGEFRINEGLFNVRIACRSSAWPSDVTQSLKEIFGDDHVQEVELAPLSEVEVRTAAEENNLDSTKFVESLKHAGLVKLALEPVTLKFLLQSFATGALAEVGTDKYKLFAQGCLALCSETNKSYLGVKRLTPKERMILASRIALYCMISNKNTIVRGDERINLQETDFTADDFVGDSFRLDDAQQTPRLEDFKEVLDSALFERVGDSQFRFKHKTYAEFLAGWHLNSMVTNVKTLHQLLTSPFDKQVVFPQLREVSGWTIAANPEFFESIAYTEPLYLISTPKEFSSAQREIIAKTLITKAKRYELMDGYDSRKFYAKLSYSGLSKLIGPLIRSRKVNNVVKRIAVNVAGACRLNDLADDLLRILADGLEPTFIRKEVVKAIAELSDEKSMNQLIPYALQSRLSDYDDEIKGSVLSVVYPKLITTSQMLNALTPVKRRSLYGAYRGFQDQVGDTIPDEDLTVVINYLLTREDAIVSGSLGDFENLVNSIVFRSWKMVIEPNVLDSFSQLIVKLLVEYVRFEIPEVDSDRRAVVENIFRNYRDSLKPYQFTMRGSPDNTSLLSLYDWDWLVELFKGEVDPDTKVYLGEIVFYLFTLDDSTHVIEFLELAYPCKPLWKRLSQWLQPIDLESEEANNQKKYRKGSASRSNANNSTEQIDGVEIINTRVTAHLIKIRAGAKDEWWKLILDLRFNHDGTSRSDADYVFDVRKLPGWVLLTDENRLGVIDAANDFLKAHIPDVQWMFTNQFNRQELGGYKALVLLLSIDEELLNDFSVEFWRNWTPVITWCTFNTLNEVPSDQERLLVLCYTKSRDEFIRFVEEYLLHQLRADKDLYDLYKFKSVTDDNLARMLLKLIYSTECSLKNQQCIIEALLKKNVVIAQEFIRRKMLSVFQEDDRTEFSLFCASRVLLNFNALDWPQFWNYLQKNREAGKAVFRAAADKLGYHRSNKLDLITPSQRAQLLVWLFKNFPSLPDDDNGDVHFTTRDNLVEFRSQVLRSLIESGTTEGVQAMKDAQEMYPESSDMKWWLANAKEILHRNAWHAVPVLQLRHVLNDAQKRFVRNSEDLTRTVLESLERFQKKLKGHNPLSPFLWDQRGSGGTNRKKKHYHKDENFLSDLIKMHLEYDLVQRRMIVNREVEIKKAVIKGQGERTDLLIEAFRDVTNDKVNLVIEVKGCWHPELDTSMETQLRNRYLDKYKSNHGLYVIGWYYGPDFAKPKKIVSKASFKKTFELQAAELSNEIVKIQSVVLDCSL
ncbi:MAG TPA: hypothetical protein VL443_05520 [Cyclobacteriaceae bacterium]|jgi:hypothetical protein|nr:hypothetical protein [Cyclobacteriaceae bacterium]